MYQSLKAKLKTLPAFRDYAKFREERAIVRRWLDEGRPAPPPHIVKQRIVKEFASRFHTKTLIETGTFQGDMIFAARNTFQQIYSIELSKDLYERAKERFAGFPHIKILHGDSSTELRGVLQRLDRPALFWLDGHYSEGITARGDLETPIRQELELIFAHAIKDHVIMIDDARAFTGEHDYPTIDELKALVSNHRPGWSCTIGTDIIRIHRAV